MDGRPLLTPTKQLIDFARVKAVKAGESVIVSYNVSSASVAEVDEASGDIASEAGEFELIFDDGSGTSSGTLSMLATVSGPRKVIEPFPSEM